MLIGACYPMLIGACNPMPIDRFAIRRRMFELLASNAQIDAAVDQMAVDYIHGCAATTIDLFCSFFGGLSGSRALYLKGGGVWWRVEGDSSLLAL